MSKTSEFTHSTNFIFGPLQAHTCMYMSCAVFNMHGPKYCVYQLCLVVIILFPVHLTNSMHIQEGISPGESMAMAILHHHLRKIYNVKEMVANSVVDLMGLLEYRLQVLSLLQHVPASDVATTLCSDLHCKSSHHGLQPHRLAQHQILLSLHNKTTMSIAQD